MDKLQNAGGFGAASPNAAPSSPSPAPPDEGPRWAATEYLQTAPRGQVDPGFQIILADGFALDLRARLAVDFMKASLAGGTCVEDTDVDAHMRLAQEAVDQFKKEGWALPVPHLKDLVKLTQIQRTMAEMGNRAQQAAQDH